MAKFLLNPSTLQQWAGKPLREWALLVYEKFQVRVSYCMLRAFYNYHNIAYRKTQKVFRQALIK